MNEFKEQKRNEARNALKAKGIVFESFNQDLHWKIGCVNFYPTTGLWKDEETDVEGHGYKDLIKYLAPKPFSGKKISVEKMFEIARKSKDRSLEGILTEIHKEIYGTP